MKTISSKVEGVNKKLYPMANALYFMKPYLPAMFEVHVYTLYMLGTVVFSQIYNTEEHDELVKITSTNIAHRFWCLSLKSVQPPIPV